MFQTQPTLLPPKAVFASFSFTQYTPHTPYFSPTVIKAYSSNSPRRITIPSKENVRTMRHYLLEVAPRTRAVSEVATCSLYWKPPPSAK